MRHCDRIIAVDNGLIVESGTHSELLAQPVTVGLDRTPVVLVFADLGVEFAE